MATIATSVRLAVDSSDMTRARSETERLADYANRANDSIGRWAVGIGAAYAGFQTITGLTQTFSDAWETASERAYDFSSNMNDDLRVQYIWLQEAQNVYNAELEQSADWMGEIGAKLDEATTKTATWFNRFMSGGEDAEQQAARMFDNLVKEAMAADGMTSAYFINTFGPDAWEERYNAYYNEYATKLRDEQQRVAQDMFDSFYASYEMQYVAADLTLDRVEKRQQLNQMRIDELRRQAVNAETDQLTDFFNWQADQLEALYEKNEEYYAEQERLQQESLEKQATAEFESLVARSTGAEAELGLRLRRELDMWEERYEQGLINEDMYLAARDRVQEEHDENLRAIWRRMDEEDLRRISAAANEMAGATSSALAIIDDDVANLFDSLNSLVSAFQTLGWLSGGGGFYGLGGGFPGMGGATYNGGVSVGTLTVTVNGGNQRTADAARQGVNDALAGMVKQQLAVESQFGGILNPSSGVTRV